LKLTLDSSEPLQDAIRVVGALYGVTIVVSEERVDLHQPATPIEPRKAARRRRAGGKGSRSGTPAVGVDAEKAKRVVASHLLRAPSNADVRSWARANGLTVRDRGRVPASILSAYRNAHGE
jgi:hypothetical protein